MNRIHTPVLALVLALLLAPEPAAAGQDKARLDAIARMGELNGIALQCRYLDQMRRIKQALIRYLPKKRELGEWFERTTQDSFMNFMKNNRECPGLIEYERDLDKASKRIAEVFGS
jgi:hypothetical protein